MADTWDIMNRRRPEARPDGLAPEPRETASAEPARRPQPRPEGLGAASEETQANATLAEALPLDRTSLIGLFHGPDGGSALLRLRSGSIVRVAAGATVDGGRVTAIAEDGLRLQKDGEEVILSMPG